MCPPDYRHNGFVATHALHALASVGFEHFVCRGSLMTTIYIYVYIYIYINIYIYNI